MNDRVWNVEDETDGEWERKLAGGHVQRIVNFFGVTTIEMAFPIILLHNTMSVPRLCLRRTLRLRNPSIPFIASQLLPYSSPSALLTVSE